MWSYMNEISLESWSSVKDMTDSRKDKYKPIDHSNIMNNLLQLY